MQGRVTGMSSFYFLHNCRGYGSHRFSGEVRLLTQLAAHKECQEIVYKRVATAYIHAVQRNIASRGSFLTKVCLAIKKLLCCDTRAHYRGLQMEQSLLDALQKYTQKSAPVRTTVPGALSDYLQAVSGGKAKPGRCPAGHDSLTRNLYRSVRFFHSCARKILPQPVSQKVPENVQIKQISNTAQKVSSPESGRVLPSSLCPVASSSLLSDSGAPGKQSLVQEEEGQRTKTAEEKGEDGESPAQSSFSGCVMMKPTLMVMMCTPTTWEKYYLEPAPSSLSFVSGLQSKPVF